MAVSNPLVLLGACLTILVSESVLLYASTALGNVPLSLPRWLLASLLAAFVWVALAGAGVLVVTRSGLPSATTAQVGIAGGALATAVLVPGLCSAPVLATSWRRGLLVSTYQLLLRALLYLLAGATAVTLLRLLFSPATD